MAKRPVKKTNQQLVEEYLANGGKVTRIPTGEISPDLRFGGFSRRKKAKTVDEPIVEPVVP